MRFVKWMFISVGFLACSSSNGSAPAKSGADAGVDSGSPDGNGSETTPGVIQVACATAVASDGVCSIREALTNAVDGKQTHVDCTAGGAQNTLVLPSACTFEFADFGTSVPEQATNECAFDHSECSSTKPCPNTICGGDHCLGSNTLCVSEDDCPQSCVGKTTPAIGSALPIVKGAVVVEGHGSTLLRKADGVAMRFFEVDAGGSLTLKDVTLSGGKAPDSGGAILVSGSLTVAGSTFIDNASTRAGAGIAGTIEGCRISVTGSKFQGGRADGDAGAIEQGSCVLEVDQTTFSRNETRGAGGAVNCNAGVAACTVKNSTFESNIADVYGGGGVSFFNDGPKAIAPCTFYGNTSKTDGGAIAAVSGPVRVDFTTISGNTAADGNGGGISIVAAAVELTGSVLEKNLAPNGEGPDVYSEEKFVTGGYNHLESAPASFVAAAGDTSGSSPNLSAPANNGGPTMTIAPNTGSPVIDAVPAGTKGCGTTFMTDQRGKPRPAISASGCDKGAVEL